MAISRFSNSTVANGFPKYQRFWDQSSVELTSAFESIATVTVGSGGVNAIAFSSIPQTYTHLQIRGIFRSTQSTQDIDLAGRYNDDTGNNYAWYYSYSNVPTPNAGNGAPDVQFSAFGRGTGATSTANVFGAFIIDIYDYTNTNKYKSHKVITGNNHNSTNSNLALLEGGTWASTAAINKISFASAAGNIAEFSQIALYGIKV